MSIRQSYQRIEPTLTVDGAPVAVEMATLSGDRIRIVVAGTGYGRTVYDGRVAEDAMSGIAVRADGGGAPWSAARAPRRR
jgi:hypothetical protein